MGHPMAMFRRMSRDPNAKRVTVKERLAALRSVPRLIHLVWETKPSYAMAMIVLRFARAVVPVTSLWIAKLIIDEVLHLARFGGSADHLWRLVALEMATAVAGEVLAR